ncbi:MAG: prepilin-type N-terminal cleavage/methylation domain-containing protein [Clostridia bacterium]|nr:prepilin-type N-terminal cleavage/methylation domain-containing protein [Clostridia bacterium]
MKNKGFSLVELIVVIAIMAILVGVAVPVYTSYIEKAEISKDKQLVDEVANALQIYYTANVASNPDGLAGYVVLTQKGTEGGSYADEVGAAAMQAIFGDNWADEVSLAYDDWTDDGLLDLVLEMKENDTLGTVAGSTFLTEATTEGMMDTVTKLTGIMTTQIANSALGEAVSRLDTLLPGNNITPTLEQLKIDQDDPEFSTVVSNLMVGQFAEMMTTPEGQSSPLTMLCATYASAYAYAETTGDDSLLKDLDTYMEGLTYDQLSKLGDEVALEEGGTTTNLFKDLGAMDSYVAFTGSEYAGADGAGSTDALAFVYMMDAVGKVAGTYTDKETLSDAGMYSSSAVAEQINNYANAVKVVASGIDTDVLNGVAPGSVVVFITNDGLISVIPGAVYSK